MYFYTWNWLRRFIMKDSLNILMAHVSKCFEIKSKLKGHLVLVALFMLFASEAFSQDSLNLKVDSSRIELSIGATSSIFNNISTMKWRYSNEKLKSIGHNMDVGYAQGLNFLCQYKKWFFEFGVDYFVENDKFTNVPDRLYRNHYYPDSINFYVEEYLDYENTVDLTLRYTQLSFLIKVNYQPIVTKKLSIGLGFGIAPSAVISEKFLNTNTNAFERQLNKININNYQTKLMGSLNIFYFITKTMSIKATPYASYSLVQRKIAGFNIRPISVGLELGFFYKLY